MTQEKEHAEAARIKVWIANRIKAYGTDASPFAWGTALVDYGLDMLAKAGFTNDQIQDALLKELGKRAAAEKKRPRAH
jgi:hypothetical protein